MSEQDKQATDQQKKHEAEKRRGEHPEEDVHAPSEQHEVGMASDPNAAKDKGYAKRIEEKTSKH